MKIKKKFKALIIVAFIFLLLFTAGLVLKNHLLKSIEERIRSAFNYSEMKLSIFPPSLAMEDARSLSASPFFSAKRIVVKISYRSLLSRSKPFTVTIEEPVLRIYEPISISGINSSDSAGILPFSIEKGLIKGGEIYYWGDDLSFQTKRINALFVFKSNFYELQLESQENVLSIGDLYRHNLGSAQLLMKGSNEEIDIQRIRINSPDAFFRAEGNLKNLRDPEFHMDSVFTLNIGLIAELLDLPFDWEGRTSGEGVLRRQDGALGITADFSSDSLFLNSVFMGSTSGKIMYVEDSGGRLDLNVRRRTVRPEYLRLELGKDRLEGYLRGVYLEPVMDYLQIPWPVSSPVWGTFTMSNDKLTAEAEFRDDLETKRKGKFPFRGPVSIEWDGIDQVSISSSDLESTFLKGKVEAEINIDKQLDINIKGEVKDVAETREFISLILQKSFDFPEIRGQGQAEVEIFGDYVSPQVRSEFTVSPGGFDRFNAEVIEGEVELIGEGFFGRFKISDPLASGRIGLFTKEEDTKVDIRMEQGQVEAILPHLDINLPLAGEASGTFEYKQTGNDIQVAGNFFGKELSFAGQDIQNVQGKLVWENDSLDLSELKFKFLKGDVEGLLWLDLPGKAFDLNFNGNSIDLAQLGSALQGIFSFNIQGKGSFGRDKARGSFQALGLELPPLQKMRSDGEIALTFTESLLEVDLKGNFYPGINDFTVGLIVPLEGNGFSTGIKGSFRNPDLLLPWKGCKGQVNYLVEVQESSGEPEIKGAVDFSGQILPFPRFAHAVRDFSGLLFINNDELTIRSLQGEFGGGDFSGSGRIRIGRNGIEMMDIDLSGQDFLLSLMERTRALTDADLKLFKDSNEFVLRGDMLFKRLLWRRELDERFTFSSSPYLQTQREPGFFDDLNLDLHLVAEDDALLENSLGAIKGRFDLRITGNIFSPIVLGEIEAIDGDVYFQDRRFSVLRGRVSFINPQMIEPYISFTGETYVKDYRVIFSLDGLLDKLNPEFSSSPPLPPEDVLALLALGESFKRTYHYDRSTQLSTTSLVSFQISEEAKKRAESLFSIDRFRIDPFILGTSSEMTARLTLGKKISRNFFILYSTNLTAQREDIFRIEWELTNDLSVVGIRNEKGRVSFDVKLHKRF
ncbi:MAG: translocation/assembly module TamB domain-containing protein [Candidatus Aminicenantes bacterium]|nr:translocation/assembly module TamB domain-containing protein [Candidatus Aminicenantes bacterium]